MNIIDLIHEQEELDLLFIQEELHEMDKSDAQALKEQMEQEAASLSIEVGKVTYTKRGYLVHFRSLIGGGGFAVPGVDAWEDWKATWRK